MAKPKIDAATIIARGNRGQEYALSMPPLPACADSLPQALRNSAQQYLSVRRQSGDALLAAVKLLSEAHKLAAYGEWSVYLETIGLDEGRARAQIRLHEEAERNPQFAEHLRSGVLSEAVARELLPAPKEVQQEVLSRGKPPTLRDVREAKRASTPAFDRPMLPDMPAPAQVADLPPEYAIIQRRYVAQGYQLLSNIQGQHRAFVTRKEGMTGVVTFNWADVLSKLERLEGQTAPARFPDLAGDWFYAHHRNESRGVLMHIWRSETSKSAKVRFVSACGMAMQHEEPRRVTDLTSATLQLCAECRQSGPSSLLRSESSSPAPPVARDDDRQSSHWVEPTCGKFVANGELAVWAGEQRERLSAKERAMLVTEARALIGSLAKMIEALT